MDYANVMPLPRSFYEQDSAVVAPKLLGKLLVRKLGDAWLSGVIVETEAYLAENDPAAHNFVGRTTRNAVLFGEAGHTYIHTMRQYHLMDIVTEGIDIPGSVLIRAIEPVDGVVGMMRLRKTKDILKLTSGPSKLCQAMQIDRSLNGLDITTNTSEIFIADSGSRLSQELIENSARIGISKAIDSPLRFYIKSSPFISQNR
jgi:DNA-3-methyladenine glycosylase